jgi:hypothetical protein
LLTHVPFVVCTQREGVKVRGSRGQARGQGSRHSPV